MPFLLIFTLFALLDFVVLFSVGSEVGLLTTVLLVLATGFIGLHLVRREGSATFARARERLGRGEVPSGELLTGAALIFGGALLMAPGFVSDALGFMCLIPDARRLMGKLLARLGMRVQGVHVHGENVHGESHRASTGQASGRPGSGPRDDWSQADEGRQRRGADKASPHTDDNVIEGDFISRDDRRG
ncbi:FxsA family protein [Halomonas halodenitrificans]|uniref:FxsA family protein n=1 Tax=Halomonas halodenitrificans TaxID=28252 RepID=UPI0004839A0A|nr:FxsA family protein [Halomonas halodenitrificans]